MSFYQKRQTKMYGSSDFIEKGIGKNFDYILLGITIVLSMVGVVAIYSANLQSESHYLHGLYLRQLVWIAISLAGMMLVTFINYQHIERFVYPLFALGLGMLALVDVMGRVIGGSQRWISFAGFNFQPSELVKLLVIIVVARILVDTEKTGGLGIPDLIKPGLVIAIPFVMVARQPDLSTAGIFFIIFAGIAYFNGIKKATIVRLSALVTLVAPIGWYLMKPYQKKRILTMLNPEEDPMGRGYHIIQSKIAIGSGGVWGKGLFAGTQSKLNFLPEKHTDFIFSVVAEEIGFIGSLILLFLFLFLILRIIDTALNARDKFGSLVCAGVVVMISFNVVYNIGMTLGLFPITGIPLPFLSYGGSSLLTNFMAIGLVLNISMRRFMIG